MFAVSLAILTQEFHGRERGTAFGIWGATVGAAVAIGPLVGGALTEWAGWRWIFFVNLPIGAACIAGAWAYLHESRDEAHGGFDALGFAFLTGGAFAPIGQATLSGVVNESMSVRLTQGSLRPTAPAPDSMPIGGKGAGDVAKSRATLPAKRISPRCRSVTRSAKPRISSLPSPFYE